MLKRLIHNAFHTLKTDKGAHFTYNIGVGFVRAGVLILIAAAVVFSWFHFKPFVILEYKGETTVSPLELRRMNGSRTDIEWVNRHFAKYRYYVILEYDEFGSKEITQEYITEDTFKYFEKQSLGASLTMNLYYTDSRFGYMHISPKNSAEAAKECRAAYPPDKGEKTSIWLLIIALPLIGVGLKQQQFAMKYPRTDVEIESTALSIMKETNVLL